MYCGCCKLWCDFKLVVFSYEFFLVKSLNQRNPTLFDNIPTPDQNLWLETLSTLKNNQQQIDIRKKDRKNSESTK